MSAKRAFYSLVQYVPDASRAEAANAGVVLYVPETKQLEVRLSPTLARVERFFKLDKQDIRRVMSTAKALEHRLGLARTEFDGEADFARFVDARADALRLSIPRLMLVTDAVRESHELYEELVGDRETVRRVKVKPALPSRLEEVFARLTSDGKAWRPEPLVVPLAKKKFPVHAAFENGVLNYVRAEAVETDDHLQSLGFHGQLIHLHKIDDRVGKLVVVSATPVADPRLETRFRETLQDFGTRFVSFQEVEAFAQEVERDAH